MSKRLFLQILLIILFILENFELKFSFKWFWQTKPDLRPGHISYSYSYFLLLTLCIFLADSRLNKILGLSVMDPRVPKSHHLFSFAFPGVEDQLSPYELLRHVYHTYFAEFNATTVTSVTHAQI